MNWRLCGEMAVFTTGCFDLLHPGHISLPYQDYALGDRLILGSNTDASVWRLKGPQRPILAEGDRAAMFSALSCVDALVLFDQDTPLEIIASLRHPGPGIGLQTTWGPLSAKWFIKRRMNSEAGDSNTGSSCLFRWV